MTVDTKLTRLLNDFLTQVDRIDCDRIDRLVAKGRDNFDADEFTRYATEALLVRLGEVVNRIDKAFPEFADQHPELELRPLKATRNVIAHGYDIVDYVIVWEVASIHIPSAATAVREFLFHG